MAASVNSLDINLLYLETLLPLEAHGKIKPGVKALVIPEPPIGGEYQASVKVVDKVLDAASGTFGVRLELPNSKLDIPAGVKCKVVFKDLLVSKGKPPVRDRRYQRKRKAPPVFAESAGAVGGETVLLVQRGTDSEFEKKPMQAALTPARGSTPLLNRYSLQAGRVTS